VIANIDRCKRHFIYPS